MILYISKWCGTPPVYTLCKGTEVKFKSDSKEEIRMFLTVMGYGLGRMFSYETDYYGFHISFTFNVTEAN